MATERVRAVYAFAYHSYWSMAETRFTRTMPLRALRILALMGIGFMPLAVMSADIQLIEIRPGLTADAYFQINLSGKVFVKIAAKPGEEACAEFWWIKWPLGNIQDLGRHCNSASFEIPGVFAGAISSKLRVGGAKNVVKLGVSASEEVANKATFEF